MSGSEESRKRPRATAATAVPGTDRLSKWARRLFDPDRPRNLVETPQVIPLNDEFLTAFGRREKEYNQALGKEIPVDNKLEDDDGEDENGSSTDVIANEVDAAIADDAVESKSRKVRINNLKFTTTYETLYSECLKFGPVQELKLFPKAGDESMNNGKAYCIFQTLQAAQECVKGLKALEGRLVRASLQLEGDQFVIKSTAPNKFASNRYWERDITTKCYNCGQVGHTANTCTNATEQKPCNFCALPGHDSFGCPYRNKCYNCNMLGHMAKDCTQRRGMPPRVICTLCFSAGHDRWQCHESSKAPNGETAQVQCMICGRYDHYTCKGMTNFFELDGMYCYNCGVKGHVGSYCRQPRFGDMAKNEGLVVAAFDSFERNSDTKNSSGDPRRHRGRSNTPVRSSSTVSSASSKHRAKSAPPIRSQPAASVDAALSAPRKSGSMGRKRQR